MSLSEKEIQRIFKKYKDVFYEMEHYDRTHEKLWEKKRTDIILKRRVINRLKEISKKTGKQSGGDVQKKSIGSYV